MGKSKEWAMELAAEGPLSTCCGAQPIGDTHETCGHHMGFCSDCREHAEFIGDEDQEEPYIPSDKELEEVDTLANVAKVKPVFSELFEELSRLRSTAVLGEHDAHAEGDDKAKQYYRGRIDAIDAIHNLATRIIF
jgi:hypothetical protein